MDGVLVMVLLVTDGYVGACVVWPFAAGRCCSEAVKLQAPSGKAWWPCPRCQGTGQRVRIGRRVWELGQRDGL